MPRGAEKHRKAIRVRGVARVGGAVAGRCGEGSAGYLQRGSAGRGLVNARQRDGLEGFAEKQAQEVQPKAAWTALPAAERKQLRWELWIGDE